MRTYAAGVPETIICDMNTQMYVWSIKVIVGLLLWHVHDEVAL